MNAHVLDAISFLMAHEFDIMRTRAAGLGLPVLTGHCAKEIEKLIHKATPAIRPEYVIHKITWGDRVCTVTFTLPSRPGDYRPYYVQAVIQSGPADVLVTRRIS